MRVFCFERVVWFCLKYCGGLQAGLGFFFFFLFSNHLMTPAAVASYRSVSTDRNLRQPLQMVTPTGKKHKSGGGRFATESKQQQQQQATLLQDQMLEPRQVKTT